MNDRSPGVSSSEGSPSQTSNSTSSSRLSVHSHGSSARYGPRPEVSSSVSPQQHGTPGLVSLLTIPYPGYVSPYPPLPSTTATHRTGTVAFATAVVAHTRPQASSSAAPSTTTSRSSEDRLLAQKRAMIAALNEHRINTIGELRRVERVFATLGSPDLTQPMTAAWMYYVNSNSLLTELRGLTRNYPFSSECLDEAKRRVHADPASNRSWNYCWLVLAKTHTDRLIPAFARAQAVRPEMWGGTVPAAQLVTQLAEAFVEEWKAALAQLLRFWEEAPVR
ncbi:hypothetical protein LTR91_006240 [Friedmanniomyces endolithicus]|uniref:Uncharacterized protein n=1 Tax=Friedmanniomyces endolithicus TaxID=329885 RepID=A0AAN6KT99_9PEZI|nr:hypothetical protein LTR57_002069 [Friedmanniomyces endolithicus]KAK0998591.1 hypothetical protein LTR91_006240 [Friedmanniomyces endolithicus]KAK1049912.1 hypothetical protein LTS16_003368 [Friedmanniomyces endolithicus]